MKRCLLCAEGPFYLPSALLLRSDISEGQAGVPLTLQVLVEDPDCQPLPGSIVDIWSANATGFYSGYSRRRGTQLSAFDIEQMVKVLSISDQDLSMTACVLTVHYL